MAGTLAVAQPKYRCCVLLTPLLVVLAIIACVVGESRFKLNAEWTSARPLEHEKQCCRRQKV